MLILGIESSCDDTAAAVVEDGRYVRSSIISSQDSIHGKYGGIVPELASRRHIEMIVPVVEEALEAAAVSMKEIDGIAVTQGPGLVGSILVGLSFAKAVSYAAEKPLTAVNHILAHPIAAFLTENGKDEAAPPAPTAPRPEFPFVALVVSGGHTSLLLMEGFNEYKVLGHTLDDAAGEAFDKTAKLLGLGYPGGAVIDRLANAGDAASVQFTRPYLSRGSLDFSFSGIKTAVATHIRKIKGDGGLGDVQIKNISASFQEAVVDVLVKKSVRALKKASTNTLVVSGGVACNSRLRTRLKEALEERGVTLFIPQKKFCSDNAAFVAALGFHQFKKGQIAGLDVNAIPTWKGF
ncbi:MAG: tRNA (adenosine(37)-N6)-threonylcarbamoyltransferase complex transferase subunit TsaD [Thermodesulfobacteriota bacterium]